MCGRGQNGHDTCGDTLLLAAANSPKTLKDLLITGRSCGAWATCLVDLSASASARPLMVCSAV